MYQTESGLIVAVDGPTGSGKSTFLRKLEGTQIRGRIPLVKRGGPSQDPYAPLNDKSRAIMEGIPTQFKEVLKLPIRELDVVLEKSMLCSTYQMEEIVRWADLGYLMLADRAPASYTGLMLLAYYVGKIDRDEELMDWATVRSREVAKEFLKPPFTKIDAEINLVAPLHIALMRPREGMAGLEDKEGEYIKMAAERYAKVRNIHLLQLDGNDYLSTDILPEKAKEFIESL